MSDQTASRPLEAGKRVRLAEHLVPHFDGQTHGVVEEVTGTRYQDVLVNVAGTTYWFASTDLTVDPENPSDTITLTLDGATMERHITDPDLDDLYAAGWSKVPGLGIHGRIETPNFPRAHGQTGTTVTGAARKDWLRVQLDEPMPGLDGEHEFVAIPASAFVPDAEPDLRAAVIEAALAWYDVVRIGNETATTVAAELLRGAVADLRAAADR